MSDTSNFMGNPQSNWYEEYYERIHDYIKERLGNCSEEKVKDKTLEVFRRAKRYLKNDEASVDNLEKWLIRIADSVCESVSSPVFWLKNGEEPIGSPKIWLICIVADCVCETTSSPVEFF